MTTGDIGARTAVRGVGEATEIGQVGNYSRGLASELERVTAFRGEVRSLDFVAVEQFAGLLQMAKERPVAEQWVLAEKVSDVY